MAIKRLFRQGGKMKNIVFILLSILIASNVFAATYYVRPISGEYGAEDGSSYAAAFDGFADAWATIGNGPNTLFICGTHTEQLTPDASGTDDDNRLQIVSCTIANGSSNDDAGIIDSVTVGGVGQGVIYLSGQDYITVDGITIQNSVGVNSTGIVINGSNYVTIKNSIIDTCSRNGIYVLNGSSNYIIEYSDIKDSFRNGFLSDDGSPAGGIIRYNLFDGNGTDTDADTCTPGDTGKSYNHNIYIGVATTGTTEIYGNKIIDGLCGQGIKAKASSTIYHNYIDGNEENGIMLIGHANKNGETVNFYVYNNVIASGGWKRPILYYDEGETTETVNIYIYNNSLYEPSGQMGISLGSNSPPDIFNVKNNAIQVDTGTYGCFYAFSGSTPSSSRDIDYNWCLGNTNSYNWQGSYQTLTQWRALGHDVNGDTADPLYTNEAIGDLTLSAGSPCIDSGINLGETFVNALDPDTTWTLQNPGIVAASVIPASQYDFGSGWEVGAFVYGEESVYGGPGTIAGGGTGTIAGGGTGTIEGTEP